MATDLVASLDIKRSFKNFSNKCHGVKIQLLLSPLNFFFFPFPLSFNDCETTFNMTLVGSLPCIVCSRQATDCPTDCFRLMKTAFR